MNPLHRQLHELALLPGDSYAQRHTREIARVRELYLTTGPQRWQNMIDAWLQTDDSACRLWQMHAANYLAHTGAVRWAIDPVRLAAVVRAAEDVDVSPLALLQVVFLTHDHVDHADTVLWDRLKAAPIQWVVPSFMKQKFIEKTGIDDDRLIEPVAGQMLHLHGLDVLPFHGQHFHTQPATQGRPPVTLGVPSLGYQIRWRDRSWLFVGDTRTYDPAALLPMQGAEILFGHVWLGRESAHFEQPPLLDAFVTFLAALKPVKQIVLAHLYEVSRPPQDCWSEDHALKVKAGIQQHLPEVKVVWALSGQEIPL